MLEVVHGRLSEYYNHFRDYTFEWCEATDTRLMGVVALRVVWKGRKTSADKLYQVIHLDFSEYGVDDYFEYECIRGNEDFREKKEEMKQQWNHFTSVMGGRIVKIGLQEMMGVLDSARQLAGDDIVRSYDNDENVSFRHYALMRWDLMREALEESGWVQQEIDELKLIDILSPFSLATCETINYFLMRLIDHDFVAARYLSTLSEEELASCPLAHTGLQTLIRNKIRQSKDSTDRAADGISYPYRCKMTTLADEGYYFSTFVIYLDADYKIRNAKVTQVTVGSMSKLSDYEAALQVQTTEYITVFDCRDRILGDFDGNRIEFLFGCEPTQVNNGWLYTVYNSDNSHVNRSEYWLNDDVYGYALLSIDGEFIMMSNKISNISYMDQCAVSSIYSPFMRLDGRYQLNTPIFHTLCDTHGVMFRDLIEHSEDY